MEFEILQNITISKISPACLISYIPFKTDKRKYSFSFDMKRKNLVKFSQLMFQPITKLLDMAGRCRGRRIHPLLASIAESKAIKNGYNKCNANTCVLNIHQYMLLLCIYFFSIVLLLILISKTVISALNNGIFPCSNGRLEKPMFFEKVESRRQLCSQYIFRFFTECSFTVYIILNKMHKIVHSPYI